MDQDPYCLDFFVVSDPHVTYPVESRERLSKDSVRILEETIEDIEKAGADLVLFGGDILEAREFGLRNLETAFRVMSKLTIPWRTIIGNHDIPYRSTKDGYKKADLIRRFSSHGPEGGNAYWRYDCPGKTITVIGLDTTVEKSTSGAIGRTQQEWLDATLSSMEDGRRVVILTHHPFILFDNEIKTSKDMDIFILENHEEIMALVEKHTCVQLVISGHNHTRRAVRENGVTYIGCPSINSWPAMYSRFAMDRNGFNVTHMEIRDREKIDESRLALLGEESPWMKSLGSSEAIEDYFTRGAISGRFQFQENRC
jgi:DNA repair exonuclease SbcCD nuclease subunit